MIERPLIKYLDTDKNDSSNANPAVAATSIENDSKFSIKQDPLKISPSLNALLWYNSNCIVSIHSGSIEQIHKQTDPKEVSVAQRL